MTFEELKAEFESFNDTAEYKDFVNSFVNNDSVSAYMETDNGKQLLDRLSDNRVTNGINTWKANHLSEEVEKEIKKRYPDKTPEQKRIAELEAKFKDAEEKALKSELTAHALELAQNKKLPTELIKYFIGKDQDSTDTNISELEKAFNAAVEKVVTERMGDSHKPDSDDKGGKDLTPDDFDKMTLDEVRDYTNKKLKKSN